MSLSPLVLRYGLFAVLATLANLAAQRLVFALVSGKASLLLAMVVGTGAGLVLKYLLDKRWIFNDAETGLKNHSRKFTLYTVMGIITTAIFWTMEAGFWLIWQTQAMRELGAVIGLAIGYVIKYHLDRRFVFGSSGMNGARA